MNKTDAVAKVLQMQKLAASTNSDGERANAESQAARLRLQHGITDSDLRGANAVDETFGGLGGMFTHMFFYRETLHPYVEAAKAEIEKALAIIDALGDTNRQVEYLSKLYDDLNGMVTSGAKEEKYSEYVAKPENVGRFRPQFAAIQRRRNEAVKKLYEEHRQRLLKQGYEPGSQHLHTMAVMYAARYVTKAQVEAIVGINEDDFLWPIFEQHRIDEVKEQGCDCKPRFTGKRTKKRGMTVNGPGTTYDCGTLVHQDGCAWQKPTG